MSPRRWLEHTRKESCVLCWFLWLSLKAVLLHSCKRIFNSLLLFMDLNAYGLFAANVLSATWRPIVFPEDSLFSYTAFCSDYTASTLSLWSAVMAIHSAWYQHGEKTHNALQPGKRKLIRNVCCAKLFTPCQCLNPSVNILAPLPLLCGWCKLPAVCC